MLTASYFFRDKLYQLAAIALLIAAEPIISSLFGYGSFSTKDVEMTADALKYFGFGVPAFALIKILSNLKSHLAFFNFQIFFLKFLILALLKSMFLGEFRRKHALK